MKESTQLAAGSNNELAPPSGLDVRLGYYPVGLITGWSLNVPCYILRYLIFGLRTLDAIFFSLDLLIFRSVRHTASVLASGEHPDSHVHGLLS